MLTSPITRAEISRSRLIANFTYLRSLLTGSKAAQPATEAAAGSELLAVVKANAYGHGLSPCAPWLVQAGAKWLGITSVEEGIALRRLCPKVQILVMRGLMHGEADAVIDAQLLPTVWEPRQLSWLADAAQKRQMALGGIPIHLEIDSGMSRQGVGLAELTNLLDTLQNLPALRLSGVYTHFASADMLDAEQNQLQRAVFRQAVDQIFAAGFHPQWIHAGNSSTLLAEQHPFQNIIPTKPGAKTLIRPGIALYGYAPRFSGSQSSAAEEARARLQPVLAWKTAIASVRSVAPGTAIGYNGTFVAQTTMRLALLPVGYADGLNRKLSSTNSSSGGHVLIHGVPAPILGRVSMDLTVVDITPIPNASASDEVVIFGEPNSGENNGQRLTADDHARWAGTIPYEILCAIAARVPRIHRD
ncbi:MAG TPA: alanine racemase [Acidobacteriaceae bacterium]|nr:alanine racemase [Acidobacteriaceae bacterium]